MWLFMEILPNLSNNLTHPACVDFLHRTLTSKHKLLQSAFAYSTGGTRMTTVTHTTEEKWRGEGEQAGAKAYTTSVFCLGHV